MTRIVYKTPDFIVIYKPAGVPSQSDKTGDDDAMTLTGGILRSMGESDTLFLIHRLDRVVGGLMLFARNKKYAAILSSMVAEHGLKKEYLAVAEGEMTDGQLVDYLYKDSILNRAVISSKSRSGAKRAELEYRVLDTAEVNGRQVSFLSVELKTGRFHQIRAQLSSRGHSLLGDKKYGNKDSGCRFPALFAAGLSFEVGGKNNVIHELPDTDSYPWSLFSKEKYEEISNL